MYSEHLEHAFEVIENTYGIKLFQSQKELAEKMCMGHLCEMRTGGGKTYSTLAAAYAKSFESNVVVLSSNVDLVARDSATFQKLFPDITCSTIFDDSQVIFSDSANLAFCFLENMDKFNDTFLIIDEVDYVLVDSINTSYGIAADDMPLAYHTTMKSAIEACLDLRMLPVDDITHLDVDFVCEKYDVDGLFDTNHAYLASHVDDRILTKVFRESEIKDYGLIRYVIGYTLQALYVMQRDKDYAVDKGKIKLIDKATGYRSEDATMDYVYQFCIEKLFGAVEKGYHIPFYSLTYPMIVRHFKDFCGCSGTMKECTAEMLETYGKVVSVIKPEYPARFQETSHIFDTFQECIEYVKNLNNSLPESEKILVVLRTDIDLMNFSKHMPGIKCIGSGNSDDTKFINEIFENNKLVASTYVCSRGIDIAQHINPIIVQVGITIPRQYRQIRGRTGRQEKVGIVHRLFYLEDLDIQGFKYKYKKLPVWVQKQIFFSLCRKRDAQLEESRLSENIPRYLNHVLFYYAQSYLKDNEYARNIILPRYFYEFTESVNNRWQVLGRPQKREQGYQFYKFMEEYTDIFEDMISWLNELSRREI